MNADERGSLRLYGEARGEIVEILEQSPESPELLLDMLTAESMAVVGDLDGLRAMLLGLEADGLVTSEPGPSHDDGPPTTWWDAPRSR